MNLRLRSLTLGVLIGAPLLALLAVRAIPAVAASAVRAPSGGTEPATSSPSSPATPAGTPILETHNASLTTYLPNSMTISSSWKQDVNPRVSDRGVGLDGGLRAGSAVGMRLHGNPFGAAVPSKRAVAGVDLVKGSPDLFEVDLSLPAKGIPWRIGRSYSNRQHDGTSDHTSSGPQGKNWFQISMPEILLYDADDDDGTEEVEDVLYLVYGAERFVEFRRVADSSKLFRATNGAAGVFEHALGATNEPDTWTYTDQVGSEFVFFGFDTDSNPAEGQLWKTVDTAGDVAFVGDSTTGSTAITSGFTSIGLRETAYDASDRRWSSSYDGNDCLTSVKAETKTGGTWTGTPTGVTEVGKVEYSYYGSSESHGSLGDLKLVERTTPLSDSGVSLTQKKYYRYWIDSDTYGNDHDLKSVLGFEGTRNYDYTDSTFDEDFLTASDSSLDLYLESYFEYDSSHRVTKAFSNGACGCSGATDGVHEYTYGTNGSYSDGTGYDQAWATRAVVEQPDGSYLTQYFDEVGQPLSSVLTDADPATGSPDTWVTSVDRNTNGVVTTVATPANVSGYTHSTGGHLKSSSTGMVTTYGLDGSGITKGFWTDRKVKEGGAGTAYLDLTLAYGAATYDVGGSEEVARPYVSSRRVYTQLITSGTTGSHAWTFAWTFHDTTGRKQLAVETRKTTEPAVSAANNGSNSANDTATYHDEAGRQTFSRDQEGIITYQEYDSFGLVSKVIADADTGKTGAGEDFENVTIPTSPESFASSGTELHWKTTSTYDAQGRRETSGAPGGQTSLSYTTKLADLRVVSLRFNDYDSGTPKYYGPVQYSVTNHAGSAEFQGVIGHSGNETTSAITNHIDESDDDPITAVDVGSLSMVSSAVFNESGAERSASRMYFDLPASGAGTEGTHYDETTFEYDERGRLTVTTEPSGTIRKSVYDLRGNMTQSWVGTNNSGGGGDNMVKTTAHEYDGAADGGNGHRTKTTQYIQDSATGSRVTSYTHDYRGRLLLEERPAAPHRFHEVDAMGRTICTGEYRDLMAVSVTADTPDSEASDRIGLFETEYDELGRAWKTTRYEVIQASGALGSSLVGSETWYDAAGRVIKSRSAGGLVKTAYDRLGRQTHEFILASDEGETTYASAADVGGDIVLEERQTVYDPGGGDVIMEAVIERFHSDFGSGETDEPLDKNLDGDPLKYTASDILGRIQIRAFWHGILGVTDVANYGTNAGSTFDRDGLSVPSRTNDILVTSTSYSDFGQVQEVTDPRGLVQRFDYDDAGRRTKVRRNYNASVNSGNPSGTDDNQTVLYEYTDGLMTKLTADLPSGSTDQETTYSYGTTKGASAGDSKIATGHLLQEVTYPDSTGATDTVTYAYDAQGQEIWREDQAGNVFETTYDDLGRETAREVTTLASGFDGLVRKITTSYTDRGMVEKVTSWDGSSNELNEVQSTYDGWGLLTDFEQDANSEIGAADSLEETTISYTYETEASNGRNTRRKTGMTLPSGDGITYAYSSTSGRHDDDVSRVTNIKNGAVVVTRYRYNGVGSVVGTLYPEADTMWKMYTGTAGSYPDLDRFNRVVASRWTKDLATDVDFFNVSIAYDRNSNPTSVTDHVHDGWDMTYTMDDLDRLTVALKEDGTPSTVGREEWTLDQVGNWDLAKLDLDGDLNYNETDEYQDDRTHNAVNELTARDVDDDGTDDYTLSYDAVGNLTDDGEASKYEYDAFGRLRKVLSQSDALVAEYKYNGLGHLISEHADTDDDGDVDGDDKWYHFVHDERWRKVATYREDDDDPKEEFVPQQAGLDGAGGSSYINGLVCRYKDANTAWTAASDGVLEETVYYHQNWRGDVSALVDDAGDMVEWVKYWAYGVPFGMPLADTDSDGDNDATDASNIQGWIDGAAYDVRGDVDLDGDVDASDKLLAQNSTATLGRDALSDVANCRSFAGYTGGLGVRAEIHVRRRVLGAFLGRWQQRDPLGYSDGESLVAYVNNSPLKFTDPDGLEKVKCGDAATGPTVHVSGEGRGVWRWLAKYNCRLDSKSRARAEANWDAECEGCPSGFKGCEPEKKTTIANEEMSCQQLRDWGESEGVRPASMLAIWLCQCSADITLELHCADCRRFKYAPSEREILRLPHLRFPRNPLGGVVP